MLKLRKLELEIDVVLDCLLSADLGLFCENTRKQMAPPLGASFTSSPLAERRKTSCSSTGMRLFRQGLSAVEDGEGLLEQALS